MQPTLPSPILRTEEHDISHFQGFIAVRRNTFHKISELPLSFPVLQRSDAIDIERLLFDSSNETAKREAEDSFLNPALISINAAPLPLNDGFLADSANSSYLYDTSIDSSFSSLSSTEKSRNLEGSKETLFLSPPHKKTSLS